MSAAGSLAARPGMRRSPSGLDTTGELAQPPVTAGHAGDRVIPVGRAPDPLVFGAQYEQPGIQLPVVHCRACGCGWSAYGGTRCWCCGKEGR